MERLVTENEQLKKINKELLTIINQIREKQERAKSAEIQTDAYKSRRDESKDLEDNENK